MLYAYIVNMINIDISNCFWRCMQFCILASDIGKWFQNSGSPVGMQKNAANLLK